MKYQFKIMDPQFRKSFYFRMLVLYSAFILIVISVSSSLLMAYLGRKIDAEIYQLNKSLLTQIQIYSDTYLVGKIQSFVIEKFVDITRNEYVFDFYAVGGGGNTANLQKIYDSISNMRLNNHFIKSIYLYRRNDDTLVSTDTKVTFNVTARDSDSHNLVYTENNRIKTLINRNLIKKCMTANETRCWVSPLENKDYWSERPVLSFCQSVPIFSTADARLGCFVVNIDQEYLFETLSTVLKSIHGDITVLDATDRLLASSNKTELYDKDFSFFLAGITAKQDDGLRIMRINGKQVAVSWLKSAINDWKYISIVPVAKLNQQKFMITQIAILLIVLLAIASLLGLKYLTMWLYKPLNKMVKAVQAHMDIVNSGDDLAVIDKGIADLATRVIEMEDTIQKNTGLIRNKIAWDLLYGNMKSLTELKSRLRLVGVNFDCKNFRLVFTKVDDTLFLKLSLEQREFVTYQLIDLIDGYFQQKCGCVTICQSNNTFISILNFGADEIGVKQVDELMGLLRNDLGLNYNMAVSETITDFTTIPKMEGLVNDYLNYGFIYGYGKVFTPEFIAQIEANNRDFDPKSLSELEIMLRSGRFAQLREEIKEIILDAKQERYSFINLHNILLQIMGMLCRVSQEQEIISPYLEKNRVNNDFFEIASIDVYYEWLCGLLEAYENNVGRRNESLEHEFMDKVINYISSHIDQQISLNSVAEKFNISVSYLSRVFKERVGVNFSEYVFNRKIEKAAELLIAAPNMKITVIAEKLGYLNLSYFSKLFKERYGMTPVQYRKKNTG